MRENTDTEKSNRRSFQVVLYAHVLEETDICSRLQYVCSIRYIYLYIIVTLSTILMGAFQLRTQATLCNTVSTSVNETH